MIQTHPWECVEHYGLRIDYIFLFYFNNNNPGHSRNNDFQMFKYSMRTQNPSDHKPSVWTYCRSQTDYYKHCFTLISIRTSVNHCRRGNEGLTGAGWAVNVLRIKNKHTSIQPHSPLSTCCWWYPMFPLQHGVIQTSPGWVRNVNVSSSGASCLRDPCLVNLAACVMASVWPHSLRPCFC